MYEYHKTGSTWDGSAAVYAHVLRALEGIPKDARVLDAGCGNGYLSSLLAERGFESHGADPSETGIALARKTYPLAHFTCMDLTEGDLPQGSFEAVTCVEVIEHVYAPRLLLSSLFKALRPGGKLVLTTPYHGYAKNLALAMSGRFDQHFNPLWDHGHIKFFSRRTLGTAIRETGFEQVKICGIGRVPALWKTMLATARRPEIPTSTHF